MKSIFSVLFLFLSFHCAIAQTAEDSLFIAKPYLQIGYHPSPSSLDLMWHVKDSKAIWLVEQRSGANSSWKEVIPVATRISVGNIAPHLIYRAALTGLLSGTVFSYRVLLNNRIVFTADAKAPKTAGQPYRFVVFGDIGAGTVDAKKLAQQAFLTQPDIVAIPGDIVYEYGLVSEYRTRFWPIYNADKANPEGAPLMRSVPFVAAPGNHDAETRDLNKNPDALAYYMFWDQPLNGPVGKEGGTLVPALTASEKTEKLLRMQLARHIQR